MDGSRFDALARHLGSRRTVLSALLAGLLPLEAVARGKDNKRKQGKGKGHDNDKGKGKNKGKDKRKDKGKSHHDKRANAQASNSCWRAGACMLKKGANVSQCDLAGYAPTAPLDCTGCNASKANLRGAKLRNANFTKANLSGACLVNADFTGATFANNTNLANAIFCNTTMPDGSVNNSGCQSGTACCGVCTVTTCEAQGAICGTISDGCGGTLTCGGCSGATPICNGNRCVACARTTDCATGQMCCGEVCVSASWKYQTSFGKTGEGEGQFSRPRGIAVSPDQRTAWVADTWHDRVSIWTRPSVTSAWAHHENFGSSGRGEGKIDENNGLAVSADGLTVWVAEAFNQRATVWTRTSVNDAWRPNATIGGGGQGVDRFTDPTSVAASPDTLMALVTDAVLGRVSVWKRASASATTWEHQGNFGNTGAEAALLGKPYGVAFSADGLTVWVADETKNRISVWTRQNANATTWEHKSNFGGSAEHQLARPRGVAISADTRTAYVTETGGARFSVWSRATVNATTWEFQGTYGSNGNTSDTFAVPYGIALSSDGQTLYIANSLIDQISIWGLTCPVQG